MKMAKSKTVFTCQNCGYQSPKWVGRCPDCNEWATMVEETIVDTPAKTKQAVSGSFAVPTPVTKIPAQGAPRVSCGISEMDRALGGGVVAGSLVLIGGDPGIGKSTILIQASTFLSRTQGTVLYLSAEESVEQIKLRSRRVGAESDDLLLVSENNIQAVSEYVIQHKPKFIVIDSIQTVYDPDLTSAAGTVSQVRSCTQVLSSIAKSSGIPVFIVGHVTKEGAIAGPKVLEHMVDTVLYFEGDRNHSYRVLRAVKNRFGSTDEIGIFEMREEGLVEVANPSEALLAERPEHSTGSVVTSTLEGSRPILVEIQALVATSYFTSPRRMCQGIDYNKMLMILAVLEKRVGLAVGNKDVYVNVAGGVRIVEPAGDLAVAVAIASSLSDCPVNPSTIVMGEVGLSGEVRSVSQTDKRLKEAARLGFDRAIIAGRSAARIASHVDAKIIATSNVRDAIQHALMAPE